jgi:hypothetical protein
MGGVLHIPPKRCTRFAGYAKIPLFWNTDLVIPKEGTPGTTAEHEGLHERSFGLDSVHQIVSCPCMKHLCQGDGAQLRMLDSPSQVVILHPAEQGKAFLTISREHSRKLFGSL